MFLHVFWQKEHFCSLWISLCVFFIWFLRFWSRPKSLSQYSHLYIPRSLWLYIMCTFSAPWLKKHFEQMSHVLVFNPSWTFLMWLLSLLILEKDLSQDLQIWFLWVVFMFWKFQFSTYYMPCDFSTKNWCTYLPENFICC